jgi:hypothetical protein
MLSASNPTPNPSSPLPIHPRTSSNMWFSFHPPSNEPG